MTVRADWSDLEAAMEVAAPRAELALVETKTSSDRVVFGVVAATDENGEVVATRTPGNGAGEDIEIRLTARIGRFGDAAREQRILDALARRLGQLHGKAIAPLDW